MKKLRSAVMGGNGKNLDNLKQMDGDIIIISKCMSYNFIFPEFVHTSDLESFNSLILKYCSKKDSYK